MADVSGRRPSVSCSLSSTCSRFRRRHAKRPRAHPVAGRMASGAVTQEPAFAGSMAPVLQTDPAWLWDRCEQLSEKAPICFRAMVARPLFWRGTWRDRGRESLAFSRSRLAAKRPSAEAEGRSLRSASFKVTPEPGDLADPAALQPAISPERVILRRAGRTTFLRLLHPGEGLASRSTPSWRGRRAASGPAVREATAWSGVAPSTVSATSLRRAARELEADAMGRRSLEQQRTSTPRGASPSVGVPARRLPPGRRSANPIVGSKTKRRSRRAAEQRVCWSPPCRQSSPGSDEHRCLVRAARGQR